MTFVDLFRKIFKRKSSPVPLDMLKELEGLAERNAARINQIKKEMGESYILHPSNTKTRLKEPRPV